MTIWIYNCSETVKNYHNNDIQPEEYFQIPEATMVEYKTSTALLSDLALGIVKISTNGTSPLYGDGNVHINALKGAVTEIDDQGRQIIRTAAASKGWTYLADSIEIETSVLSSLHNKDYLGNSIAGVTLKFFDINGTELTAQGSIDTDCVKTEMLFKPSYDYEIVGGNVHQISVPSDDIRLWVVGGLIELGGAYVKEMVRGMNMRHLNLGDHIRTDGRAAKYMKKDIVGVPYQGNQLKFIFKHPAGVKHKVMVVLEYFRA